MNCVHIHLSLPGPHCELLYEIKYRDLFIVPYLTSYSPISFRWVLRYSETAMTSYRKVQTDIRKHWGVSDTDKVDGECNEHLEHSGLRTLPSAAPRVSFRFNFSFCLP